DDALQAAFLALARNASSVRKRQSLASWLYGVAHRLSLKARAKAACRRRHERAAGQSPSVEPQAEVTLREAQAVFDEELARLPEKYRDPLVLCCLEGLARDEAAARLGWSPSTFKSRLEEARNRLRRRLPRRCLTLPAVLSAAR